MSLGSSFIRSKNLSYNEINYILGGLKLWNFGE